MSYILEALKKAQAERQLGNAPTLHAPTLQSQDRASSGGRLKKPLLLVIAAMAVVIAALVALVLRPTTAPEAPAVPASGPAQAAVPASAMPAPAANLPAQARADVAPPPSPAPAAPLPDPVAALPVPVATLTPAARKHVDPQSAATGGAGNPAGAVAAANNAGATAAKPAAAFEEPVQNLRDLPEPIQRSIPQVAVGGYIYSKNPADRLLLIDKVLRHEGEEVAPGLKLEKLNPREAVFNFKGYRYRVPY
nr:general secretion pathway protein GspB [uncultured Duganella sp.]